MLIHYHPVPEGMERSNLFILSRMDGLAGVSDMGARIQSLKAGGMPLWLHEGWKSAFREGKGLDSSRAVSPLRCTLPWALARFNSALWRLLFVRVFVALIFLALIRPKKL